LSVQVQNITKTYGTQNAVDNISFAVREGEIVGFLGPNGAGKTTTMKILTGFIPQTKGEAHVCNLNVNEKPIESRKKIGYLPEHNPLYLDMYVKEYLSFISKVHHIKNSKNRIAEIIDLTGLQIEQKKKIGQLSKGYRQRVGLASALVHNPEVLILDEPTTGLDPNQLAEIRQLIKNLGKNKTLIFSTHIMQEGTKNVYEIEFLSPVESILPKLKTIEGIDAVQQKTDQLYQCQSSSDKDLRAEFFNFAVQHNLTLIGLSRKESSLEDVFKKLTQQKSA